MLNIIFLSISFHVLGHIWLFVMLSLFRFFMYLSVPKNYRLLTNVWIFIKLGTDMYSVMF